MSLGLKYWYKSQLNSLYIDVTNYVTEQVRGSNSINEMPSNFEFTLSVPKNGSDYIEVVSGDEIAITFDETCTSLLIHGNIIDSGIDIISFDRLRNKPFYKYNIICSQKDFSNTIIDTLDYTDTNLSVILDELMNYSDESIGSPYLSKYAVNFADYQISSFSVEKKTVREALTDLCQQIDCFWKLNYIVSPDNVNVLFVNRYIEISNKSGIMPLSSSIWQNGITTSIVKNGVISNPIIGNTSILANVVAETELKIKQDTSVICNSVELIGKIFTNNDSNSLYRYDFRAEPSKFEYILNGYASDIVYVAFQLKDPKDPVRIMSGSTTTVIKIPSRYAVGIEVGNKAYFQNDDTINFYPIDTVTKIDIYYTEIGFSTPLPFTIVEGHSFEIASNVTIYEEKYNLNYSQKGVVKYVNKDTEARIKFLDLSEPPPGVFITVFYKKIQDYKIKFQNDVSKNLFGLKYKEIKLDDDIVLTQLEMDNLSSNLLVLEPKLTFSVNSKRYGLAPVGMNIPVIVNGFLNQNFILQNNSWEYLGKDPQKQHVFNQDLDFSNIINNPENYIKSLKKRKATKSTELNTKDILKELLNITENINYSTALITTKDLVTDSYDLFYYRNQNGSGNTITDSLILNDGTISGTANWESGIISGDNYSLRLDGSTNYINTSSNDSTSFVDFTKRKALRFETGNKAAKSFHPIIGKYDYYAFTSVNGWNFISEFIPSTNKIILYVFDDTSTLVSLKYRTYEVTYNLLENVDYILQIAFKLDDPSNSHLNTAEICVNGVKISGSWTDYGISNITTIKNQTQEIKIGAERGTGSTHDVAKFKSLRSALSTRFRTEAEALDDYNNLFT